MRIFGVLVCIILCATSFADAALKPLVFAIPSMGAPDSARERWAPLVSDLSHEIDAPVKLEVFDDYAGVIWALRAGKAQFAWLGNKGAIEAVDRAGAQVLAQFISASGQGGYYSHLITRKASSLRNVEDVIAHAKEIAFGFGDPNSTSGTLIPGYYVFAKRGLAPETMFKRMPRAGHESNFSAVVDGYVDVATNNSANLARMARRDPERIEEIKVIWTSPLIPSDPILVKRSQPGALKKRVARFLKQYGAQGSKPPSQVEHEQRVLKKLNLAGFAESDDSQLLPIRKIKLYKELSHVSADMSKTEAERKRLAAAIEEKLNALEKL